MNYLSAGFFSRNSFYQYDNYRQWNDANTRLVEDKCTSKTPILTDVACKGIHARKPRHKCGLLLACVIITTVSCERRHEYREFSVVRALVTINRAESEFFKKCRRYASLSELGPTGMSLVSQELASRGVS